MNKEAYDDFSGDYDRFVNWEERLSAEMPFLLEKLSAVAPEKNRPVHVLDAACGTGMHAIALAKAGNRASGADISTEMVRAAKENARAAQLNIEFKTAGFGMLAEAFTGSSSYPFDSIICLGNSLPHLLSQQAILDGLVDVANCLRPGGLLLLQNRNFDAVMAEKNRWLGTQSQVDGSHEWLFLRFYDFDPDGLITFNIIRLHRDGSGNWTQQESVTRLFPLKQENLLHLLEKAGFHQISCFGQMGNETFDPAKSGNLVVTAVKK
jgi:SAM-dependent methyltransferase